jgi:hypothetical protein
VGFVVDKVALGQVFSEYFGPPVNLHSTSCSTIILTYHPALVQQARSGRSTRDLVPLQEQYKKKSTSFICAFEDSNMNESELVPSLVKADVSKPELDITDRQRL